LLTYGIRPNNSAFNDYAFIGVPNNVGSTLNFFDAGVLLVGRIELFAQPPGLFSIVLPPIERLPSPFVPVKQLRTNSLFGDLNEFG
jgi:hypothetical protein